MSKKLTTIEVYILDESPKALQVAADEEDDGVWIAKSLIDNLHDIEDGTAIEDGSPVEIDIPEWIAFKEGLI